MNYENRYVLMLLSMVLNQKPVPVLRNKISWETILKTAEYHHIVTLVYLGILGIEKEVTEDFQDRFYQKYKKELLLGESYREVEKVIIWQLERFQIKSVLLSGTDDRAYYPQWEQGYTDAIEVLADTEDLPKIREIMKSMDYEEKENRLDAGVLFVRVPGVRVIFRDRIPVENKVLNRYLSGSFRKYQKTEGQQYLRRLRPEGEYLYRVGRLVEQYLQGELKIRTILDFWRYFIHLPSDFPWSQTEEILEKARLVRFVEEMEGLAALWFGAKGGTETKTALELEEYVLSQGKENHRLDRELLPYERARPDFYRRNREQEWSEAKKEWLFPPREYMAQYYPALEKAPFLIGIFWLHRTGRIFKNMLTGFWKRVSSGFKERCSRLKQKIWDRFLASEDKDSS